MLKNKKVVIVGGSSGIGLGVARKAADVGAEIVIASRSASKLENARSHLRGRVQTEVLDAVNEQSVSDFFRRVGSFDHLVATIRPQGPVGRFLENATDNVRAAFDNKFWGQYYLAKHGAGYVRAGGSITLTSGIASLRSYPGYSAMTTINAAVESLCKTLAVELAPIRVNGVCPGFVDIEAPNDKRAQQIMALIPNLPLARLGTADEIADAYLYLLNNVYSTGTIIVVDGGATC
ncbi:MAG: SDR family oxidoreductase [Nitrospirae bacterium]|nr:SDR family oxidoreductase [Nitrospirota bacterium]